MELIDVAEETVTTQRAEPSPSQRPTVAIACEVGVRRVSIQATASADASSAATGASQTTAISATVVTARNIAPR